MEDRERILKALKETEILKFPDKLISTSKSTKLHYYMLSKFSEDDEDGPQRTRIREGNIIWDKPKLLTPGYISRMEGFSLEARKAFQIVAGRTPDLAGLFYKMNYKKESLRSFNVSKSIESTYERLKSDIEAKGAILTAVIKGIDELWDVSLAKFIQQLIVKSAMNSQMPYYQNRGLMSKDESGNPVVTRNLEGLPIAASKEIEEMFARVKNGELDPSKLKKELDNWGVYKAYEDRFLNLFRK